MTNRFAWLFLIFAAPASAAAYITQEGTVVFAQSDFTYLSKYVSAYEHAPDISFPVFDTGPGILDGDEAGKYGYKITASATLSAAIAAHASVQNQLGYVWGQDYSTYVIGADGAGGSTVGSTFTLGTNASFNANSLLVSNAGKFQAGLDLYTQAGLKADASACIYACGNLSLSLKMPTIQTTLLGYNSDTNVATFLGQTHNDALPYTFSSADQIFSATIDKPDLTGASFSADPNVATLQTSSPLAGAFINIAAAVAQIIGVPPEVLKGSALGFNYETIGAYLGVALNLVQDITLTPSVAATRYTFTSPVEVQDVATQMWGAPTTSLEIGLNQNVTLRAPFATSLGITVDHEASFKSQTDLTAEAAIVSIIRLLHIDGWGIDWSLVDRADSLYDLGAFFTVHDQEYSSLLHVAEALPLNLAFEQLAETPCPDGCQSKGVVTLSHPLSNDPDSPIVNLLLTATNYNSVNCNAGYNSGCIYDTSHPPHFNETRWVMRNGMRVQETTSDFTSVEQLLASPLGQRDPAEDVRRAFAMLLRTYPHGMLPSLDIIPHGASGDTVIPQDFRVAVNFAAAVPEPSTWSELMLGFGLIGGIIRRRGNRREPRLNK